MADPPTRRSPGRQVALVVGMGVVVGVVAGTLSGLVFHEDDWLSRALTWAAMAVVVSGFQAWLLPRSRRDAVENQRIRDEAQANEARRRAADAEQVLRRHKRDR